jgi:uncharacterized protein YciI
MPFEEASMAATPRSVGELTSRMLRKKFHVILTRAQGAAPEAIAQHLPAHLEYMIALEKQGVLFASGPFTEADGTQRGNGMSIVRAESVEAARKLAEADPFFVARLRTYEVREWTVMEGSVGLTVNFSDQTYSFA